MHVDSFSAGLLEESSQNIVLPVDTMLELLCSQGFGFCCWTSTHPTEEHLSQKPSEQRFLPFLFLLTFIFLFVGFKIN